MKNQALFSSKDKSKKLKCRLLQFSFGALRVNMLEGKIASYPICLLLFFILISHLASFQLKGILFYFCLVICMQTTNNTHDLFNGKHFIYNSCK